MIERYVEVYGPDEGRVKDVGIAVDLAYTEAAWREEGDGTPMLNPPERLGKLEVHFRDIVNDELKRLIMAAAEEEIDQEFRSIYDKPGARQGDPEVSDEAWIRYRTANSTLTIYGEKQ